MKKTAVIGFGFMGMTHAWNIIKSNQLELTAIIDKDLEGIEEKLHSDDGNFSSDKIDQELIRNIHKYLSLKECLKNDALDVVYICVHTDLHYAIAKEALESGLDVFLEKPMTLDVGKGSELIALCYFFEFKASFHGVIFCLEFSQGPGYISHGAIIRQPFANLAGIYRPVRGEQEGFYHQFK